MILKFWLGPLSYKTSGRCFDDARNNRYPGWKRQNFFFFPFFLSWANAMMMMMMKVNEIRISLELKFVVVVVVFSQCRHKNG
jgi:hypothetical protein